MVGKEGRGSLKGRDFNYSFPRNMGKWSAVDRGTLGTSGS